MILNVDMISPSISATSDELNDSVTVVVTSMEATNPVLDGATLGKLVVGETIGCLVGFDVTYAA